MKLKQDCIRDTLLYLEEKLEYNNLISAKNINLPKYSSEDIKYTLKKLSEANFIIIVGEDMSDNFSVKTITYYGHQFLDNIRDNEVWKTTKTILSKFSSTSISIMENVAAQVITNLIQGSIQ